MLSFLILSAAAVLAQGTTSITSDGTEKKEFYRANDKIVLTCRNTENSAVSWFRVNPITGEKQALTTATVKSGTNGAESTLELVVSTVADSGEYRCENTKDPKDAQSQHINVFGDNALQGRNNVTDGVPEQVILRCDQPYNPKVPLRWYFLNSTGAGNLVDLSSPDLAKNFTVQGADRNYSLALKLEAHQRWPSKFGTYVCEFNSTLPELAGQRGYSNWSATPDVYFEGATKAKSATKGEQTSLVCAVAGDADVGAVSLALNRTSNGTMVPIWTEGEGDCKIEKDEAGVEQRSVCIISPKYSVIDDLNRTQSSCPPESGLRGGCVRYFTLVVNEVTDDDAGIFHCTVAPVNAATSRTLAGEPISSTTVTLKVKDKFAALWPFLGIVAEVVILCAIIFIYEKRRSKTVEEEEEAEPMKTVDARGDDNLRNRKA